MNVSDAPVDMPYDWTNDQESYHYYNSNGSILVNATTVTIDGTIYNQFTVGNSLNVLNSAGTYQYALAAGTLVATNSSTTGASNPGFMVFYKAKSGYHAWGDLITGASYGFIDFGLQYGSTPRDRPIR